MLAARLSVGAVLYRDPMLIRLFRGVIREGAHDRLLRGLHDHVLPRLEAHPGVTSTTLAVAMEGSPDEYLVESHWRDVDDLIRFAGDDWRTPRVSPPKRSSSSPFPLTTS